LPLGSVGFDHERTTNGGLVWLDARTMNNLEALRQPGEAWEPLGAQKQRNGQLEQSWTPAFA
jgi:hypothetical protein